MMKIKEYLIKNKDFILYSFLITLFIFIPLYGNDIFGGHDLSFHLSRFTGIISAIQDKQFPLSIYPYKNFGYGYASPMFYSDLFLIIPAVLAYITPISLVVMYKILLFIILFLTSYFMMSTTYNVFNNKIVSIISAIVLIGSEYYLVDFHMRSALGELLATCLLPLLFYASYKFIVLEKDNYLSLGIVFALILYCHNITFLLSVMTFGIFLVLNIDKLIKNKKMLITLLKGSVVGFLLAFAFLMPMLDQYFAQYLRVRQATINTFGADSIKLNELFSDFFIQYNFKFNNYLNNDYVGSIKNLGLLCGVIPLIYLFVKKQKNITQLFIIFILYLFMSTEFFPIENFSFLNFLQFSPRFYIILPLIVSYIVAYSLNNLSFKIQKISLIIIILYTIINSLFLFTALISDNEAVRIPNNANEKEIFEEEKYFKHKSKDSNWNWYELGNAEYLPDRYFIYPKEDRCLDDNYSNHISCEYERVGTHFIFDLNLDKEMTVQVPLTWYKGYSINEIDNNGNILNKMYTYSSEYRGRLAFDGLKGNHRYEVKYVGTKAQKISCVVTGLSVIAIIIYELKRKKNEI